MHRRLGSATPSQLAFPVEGNPNFPWVKFHWDNTVVESKVVGERGFRANRAGSIVDWKREMRVTKAMKVEGERGSECKQSREYCGLEAGDESDQGNESGRGERF